VYLVAFAVHDLGGSPIAAVTPTGNNITWSRVGNDVGGGVTQPAMAVWAGYADSSASAGSITFSGAVPSGQTADGAIWGIAALTDVARGSDLGMVQSAVASTTADTVTATLGTFASSSNATGGWFLSYDNAGGTLTNTAGSGFAIVTGLNAQQASGGDTMRLSFEFRNDNDTSVDGTASAANDRMLMHAVEIRAAITGTGSASVAGDGQVAATGLAARSGSASVAGSGSVSASGVAARAGAATLSGSGAVAAAGTSQAQQNGSAALSGAGALAGSGNAARAAAGSLAGAGAVAAAGVAVRAGQGTVAGDGFVSGVGLRTGLGQAAITGTGTVAASSGVARAGQGSVAGSGAVGGSGVRVASGSATLSGSGVVSGSGGEPGGAALAGAGVVSASGSAARFGGAAVSGSGTVVVAGSKIGSGQGSLDGAGVVSAGGGLPLPPASSWRPKRKPPGPLYGLRTRLVVSVRVIVGPATVQLPVVSSTVVPSFEVVARRLGWGTLVECRARPVRGAATCVLRDRRRVETRTALSAVERVWRPEAVRWVHQQRLVGAVAAAISEVTYAPD